MGSFVGNTRLKIVKGTTLTRNTGGGVSYTELPKTGILMGVFLPIRGSVAGTLSAPNALGMASIVRRFTLRLNAGHVIYDTSGASYYYLVSEMLQDNYNLNIYNTSRNAVTATSFILDAFIPVSLNTRDEIGLLMLQNMQTFVSLSVDFEADATVATGATVTATVTPLYLIAEVPASADNMPKLNTIHQIVEDQVTVAASGQYDHQIQIGATLVGVYYLFPSAYTNAQLIVQQTNVVYDTTPEAQQLLFALSTSRDSTLSGALSGFNKRIFWDFSGSDGLGQFGSVRDWLNTQALTSVFTRIQASSSGTLYAVRRQILPLEA